MNATAKKPRTAARRTTAEPALSRALLERIARRRGRLAVFDRLEGKRTALLVIDMQTAFVAPGAAAEVPAARRIVPTINRLAESVRARGGRVVWVLMQHQPRDARAWSVFFRGFLSPAQSASLIEALRPDRPGSALWRDMDRRDGDWTAIKNRFSAFIQGASDLEIRLRAAGIDTVVIAGTVTNVCCESTARDAMMRNFKTILVSDACAARSDEEHKASLASLFWTFADVATADDVAARLEPARRPLPSRRQASDRPNRRQNRSSNTVQGGKR
jgi:ureidoacrylate peracid hydrolase